MVRRHWALAFLAIAALAAVPGCGESQHGSQSTEVSAKQERMYPNVHGPTRQFLIKGGDNVVQFFGREATAGERRQTTRVIHKWLQARAAQAWTRDCSYFATSYARSLTKDAHGVTGGRVKTCPQALAYFGHEASGSYRNNLAGPIVSLRVGEGHGYAQYHGNDGHDWIVPVSHEHGMWMVATATPIGRSS